MSRSVAASDRPSAAVDAIPVEPPIKLMIVDDSRVARAVLSRMLSAHDGLEVVAQAGNAREALTILKKVKVDIVLLDVEMPGTSGLEALPDIVSCGDGARVLVVSSLCEDGAESAVKALALGAADTLPKPGAEHFSGRFSEILAERLVRIGRCEHLTPPAGKKIQRPPTRLSLRPMPDQRLACLALGASTGGLHALNEFLCALPPKIGAPILITQHLPPAFMSYFARQIEAASSRVTRVAEQGSVLRADEIMVAPGEAHIGLRRHGVKVMIELRNDLVSTGCMPSVDPMLESVAETYGKSAVGIIFSGMGRDGLAGSACLVGRGGAVLVQDEFSSAVWGMPGVVAQAGLASAILPPAELARQLAAGITGASWK